MVTFQRADKQAARLLQRPPLPQVADLRQTADERLGCAVTGRLSNERRPTELPGRDTADRHLAPVDLTFPRHLRQRARTAPRQWMGELGWVFRIEHRHLSSAQCHGPADWRGVL